MPNTSVLVCIAIRANICQHVLACIALVFGMYEIMIRANTDQIHAFVFQYVPIRTQIHSPIWAQYNQIQTNTSSNTDKNKLEYRPIQAQIQTNAHIFVFNTCTSTCQYRHWYCQITHPHQHPLLPVCQRYLGLPSRNFFIHPASPTGATKQVQLTP